MSNEGSQCRGIGAWSCISKKMPDLTDGFDWIDEQQEEVSIW
jgi:hypothetical protein